MILSSLQDIQCQSLTSNEADFSDHHIVHFDLSAGNAITDPNFCSYRNIKEVKPVAFANDVSSLLQDVQINDLSAKDASDLYHSVLKDIIDSHTPLKTKTVPNHPKLPWFNDNLAKAIRCRQRAERVWCHDKSNNDNYMHFYRARRHVPYKLDKGEQMYYLKAFQDNKTNFKEVFRICNRLLCRSKDLPLTSNQTIEELANHFNNFFITKIENIRKHLFPTNNQTALHQVKLSVLPV